MLALPMEEHDGEDQKDLNQPTMQILYPDPGVQYQNTVLATGKSRASLMHR